jgi:hypothetical protein
MLVEVRPVSCRCCRVERRMLEQFQFERALERALERVLDRV